MNHALILPLLVPLFVGALLLLCALGAARARAGG